MSRKKKRPPAIPKVQSDALYRAAYESRRAIADRQLKAWFEAVSHCGPGATAYARWQIVDRLGELPDRFIYCCRRPHLQGWQPGPDFPGSDERLGPDNHPGYTVKGVTGYPYRFETRFNYIERYEPQSPEAMKAAAEKRRAKALEKAAADAERRRRFETPSLFAAVEEAGP